MKLKYDGLAPKMARFQKLLEQFVATNIARPRERTLLELARVSRSELAYSNLWKFFFTPNEEHRLGDNALRSLFEAAGARFDTTDFSSAEVEREVITPSGKFIDLLVTTRSLIVAVENKIDAPLYNDLADYSDYIDQRAHGRRPIKVVLCLSEGDACFPFTRVTYKKFFARLRNNLERVEVRSTINNRYLNYLNDIMATIDDLNQKKQTDRAFRRFVTKNEKATIVLVRRVSGMKEEFHEKIRELERLIRVKPVRKGIYKSQTVETQIYESLWLKYTTKRKALIEVEAWISAVGWQVEAYREKDPVRGTKRRFDYDIPVSKVADYVHKLIGLIKTKLRT